MPMPPQILMVSARIKKLVRIINAGVKARKGTDKDIGDIFMA